MAILDGPSVWLASQFVSARISDNPVDGRYEMDSVLEGSISRTSASMP